MLSGVNSPASCSARALSVSMVSSFKAPRQPTERLGSASDCSMGVTSCDSLSIVSIFSILLKYLTVLTCNSSVAASSTAMVESGCIWSAERVYMWFTPPSMHFCSASALCAPVTMMTTSRASRMVCTPTLRAVWGTLVMSLSKKRELARMVSSASGTALVRDERDDPGSLKAMWPSGPTPPRKSSMPPAALMRSS